MVTVPKAMWGNFYSGDSYIVMNEKKDAFGNVAYDLHMWIGKIVLVCILSKYRSTISRRCEINFQTGSTPSPLFSQIKHNCNFCYVLCVGTSTHAITNRCLGGRCKQVICVVA